MPVSAARSANGLRPGMPMPPKSWRRQQRLVQRPQLVIEYWFSHALFANETMKKVTERDAGSRPLSAHWLV
jgi:hypothetical protein